MDIKELIGQHGKSVALVFKQLGINAPVTEREVVYAILVYQDSFIDAIAAELDKYTGFGEDEPAPHGSEPYPPQGNAFGQLQTMQSVTVANKKKNNWLQTATGILSAVTDSAAKIIAAKNAGKQPGYVQTQAGNTSNNDGAGDKKKPNWWVIGGIGLAMALLIAVVVTQKKN